MNRYFLTVLRNKSKLLLKGVAIIFVAFTLIPGQLSGADAKKLRVGILASSQNGGEFDSALQTPGWSVKKYPDSNQGWEQLKNDFGNLDLIIGTPGLKDILPKSKEAAGAMVNFMKNGGAVILTQATEPEQLNWLSLIDPKLELIGETPGKKPTAFRISESKPPHSFRSAPSQLSDTKNIEKYYRSKSSKEWEWGAGWMNKPCFLIKRFDKGYLVISALRHPNADLFENAALMLRLQKMGISYRNISYHFSGNNTIVPGRGEVRINLVNTSGKELDATGVFRLSNAIETREIKRTASSMKKGARAFVSLPVMADLTGKCRMRVLFVDPSDNSEILLLDKELELPEFLSVIPPAYRGMISTVRRDPNVHFKLQMMPSHQNLEEYSVKLEISDPSGNIVSVKEVTAQDGEFPVVMELDANAPAGTYTITGTAQHSGTPLQKAQAQFKIVPVRPGQVFVDQDTVILRDGKPFFPLGIYHVSGKNQEMEDAAKLGFNFFQVWTWDVKPENLRRLAKLNMGILWEGKAWEAVVRIPQNTPLEEGLVDPGFQKELDNMRKAAAELKNNPLLTMWYIADEPPTSRLPWLRRINEVWHELDEDHPTYLVATGNYKKLQDACDILAIDVYTVYRGQRNHLSRIANATDDAMKGVDYRKPVIAIPQAFGNNKRHNETPKDLRCISYLHLVRGVRGMVWYCWKETGDKTGEEGVAHHPASLAVLKELVAEIKELSPALMEPGRRMLKSTNGHVHALICGSEKTERYLIYVNADLEASNAMLVVPELESKTLTGLFGTRAASVQGGTLEFKVEAQETGVFRIK